MLLFRLSVYKTNREYIMSPILNVKRYKRGTPFSTGRKLPLKQFTETEILNFVFSVIADCFNKRE